MMTFLFQNVANDIHECVPLLGEQSVLKLTDGMPEDQTSSSSQSGHQLVRLTPKTAE